jgi:hypothetical protein
MALEAEIGAAAQAVQHAQRVRIAHRRRTPKGSPQREQDIKLALERLHDAMRPLRSFIGRAPFVNSPKTEVDEALHASQAIQKERRKLWKMQRRLK